MHMIGTGGVKVPHICSHVFGFEAASCSPTPNRERRLGSSPYQVSSVALEARLQCSASGGHAYLQGANDRREMCIITLRRSKTNII